MGSQRPGYVYMWEFHVRPERAREFERAYGPGGPWVELFRRGAGYVRTELLRDRRTAGRYVTIDYWESVEAFEVFRASRSDEFESLDARCEDLTRDERELGGFEPVD